MLEAQVRRTAQKLHQPATFVLPPLDPKECLAVETGCDEAAGMLRGCYVVWLCAAATVLMELLWLAYLFCCCCAARVMLIGPSPSQQPGISHGHVVAGRAASHMAELGRCCGCCGGETGGRICALPGRITGERWPRGPPAHPPCSGMSAAIANGVIGGVPGGPATPAWLTAADLRLHTKLLHICAAHDSGVTRPETSATPGSLKLARCCCCWEHHLEASNNAGVRPDQML